MQLFKLKRLPAQITRLFIAVGKAIKTMITRAHLEASVIIKQVAYIVWNISVENTAFGGNEPLDLRIQEPNFSLCTYETPLLFLKKPRKLSNQLINFVRTYGNRIYPECSVSDTHWRMLRRSVRICHLTDIITAVLEDIPSWGAFEEFSLKLYKLKRVSRN